MTSENRDIVFVNAIFFNRFRLPEIGSIILNNIVKKEYSSEIINFDILMREGKVIIPETTEDVILVFSDYLTRFNPKIVQFYSICTTHPLSILIAKRVKELLPDSTILFGGPHATMSAKENLLKYPFIDIIGMFEGETYFLNLIRSVYNKTCLNKVDGIAFRDFKGDIKINRLTKEFEYSEEKAAYMYFDYKKYLDELENLGISRGSYDFQLEAGRGCPFECSFCSSSIFWRRKFKVKSAETLIKEMNFFNVKYGIRKFSIDHDMFTSNKDYIIDFCNKVKENSGEINWGCSSRIDVLDYNILNKMKDSKCTSIYIGIETGSEDMQKRIKKRLDLKKVLELITYAKKIGIEITTSFIYGFPLESEEEFIETIKLIEKMYFLNVDIIQLHKFFPLINTYEISKVNKLFLNENADFSIIPNSELYGKEIFDIIKDDSFIYSCFYDFESEIRNKYNNFGLLISCFSMFYKIYGLALKALIERIGLIQIYDLFLDDINEFRIKMYNRTIIEYYYGEHDNTYSYELLKKILCKSRKLVDDDLYVDLVRYCDTLHNVVISKANIEKLILFNYDIFGANKKCQLKNNQMFMYKISKKDGNIEVKKMGSLDV